MEVVKPQNVGVIPVCPPQKAPCGSSGGKTMIIQQARGDTVKPYIKIGANTNRKATVAFRHSAVSAKGNLCLVPFPLTVFCNGTAYFAGASNATNSVYD